MTQEKFKYSAITSMVLGCEMMVHKTLGTRFQEVIYQRAPEIEMGVAGIVISGEFEMPIFYR